MLRYFFKPISIPKVIKILNLTFFFNVFRLQRDLYVFVLECNTFSKFFNCGIEVDKMKKGIYFKLFSNTFNLAVLMT